MTSNIHELMKTEHYHPSLNSAVFDGSLRIYFNQEDEKYALNLYFVLQKKIESLKEELDLRTGELTQGPSLSPYFVVLIYPNQELYLRGGSSNQSSQFTHLEFGEDQVFLTRAHLEDELLKPFIKFVETQMMKKILVNINPEASALLM